MTPPRWFKGDLTAWAIHVSIFRWHLAECQQLTHRKSAA